MHLFDQDIRVTPDGDARYKTMVAGNWSINETPNGGYLMALLARAATADSAKHRLSILTANFIARGRPGPAEMAVEQVGVTRNFDRRQVKLFQGGSEKVRALITLMNGSADSAGNRYEKEPPVVAPAADCIAFGDMPGYTLFDNMDVLLDPDCAGWLTGELGRCSELRGWVHFKEPRLFDPPALLLVADAFPPPVFASQGMVAWVPTIEMSVNIRNVPDTRWLKCVFRTRFLNGGMVEEDGEIWDEADELVAISRQVAQYRKA